MSQSRKRNSDQHDLPEEHMKNHHRFMGKQPLVICKKSSEKRQERYRQYEQVVTRGDKPHFRGKYPSEKENDTGNDDQQGHDISNSLG